MRTRGVTFILSVLLTAVLLAGCSGGEAITGENLEDYLPELLEQEVFFEGVYRGGGLPTTPNAPYEPDENYQCFVAVTDENYQCFVPVTDENYPSAAALKKATERVFTAEYAQENFYLWAFEGDTPRYKDVDGQLCMDIGQGGGLDKQWDPESFAVISEDDTAIDITVEYLNYGSVRTAALTLVKTEDGLRIDAMEG